MPGRSGVAICRQGAFWLIPILGPKRSQTFAEVPLVGIVTGNGRNLDEWVHEHMPA